jgi:hypothetical protein
MREGKIASQKMILLAFVLVFSWGATKNALAQVPKMVIDQVSRATVFVETDKGTGSGFLFSSDGYILTCAHVVAGAARIRVWLFDGRSYTAKVVNTAGEIDAAILKIEVQGAPYVTLGSSESLAYGDAVAAIGYPLKVFTVTTGTVSAFPKVGSVEIVQITAPVNPGNSGGPLVRYSGEVVGIIFASADAGEYLRKYGFIPQGMNYAIPIDLIKARFGLDSLEWRLFLEGQVVFRDDFTQPAGWGFHDFPDGLSGVFADALLGRGYHLIRHSKAGWHYAGIPGITVTNFILEFDIRSASARPDKPERFIVMFRFRWNDPTFDYYLLNIFTDGFIELIAVKRDEWFWIVPKQASVAVNRHQEVNHVCIIAKNNRILVEINRQKVIDITDNLVTAGGGINIGVWTFSDMDNAHIVFTNVIVYRLP